PGWGVARPPGGRVRPALARLGPFRPHGPGLPSGGGPGRDRQRAGGRAGQACGRLPGPRVPGDPHLPAGSAAPPGGSGRPDRARSRGRRPRGLPDPHRPPPVPAHGRGGPGGDGPAWGRRADGPPDPRGAHRRGGSLPGGGGGAGRAGGRGKDVRTLVTGGAGFVGAHLVRALLDAGHTVAVLDDLSAGRAERVPAGVPLYQIPLEDRTAVDRVVAEARAQAVFHLAAQVDVQTALRDPLQRLAVHVAGTGNPLEARRKQRADRVVAEARPQAVFHLAAQVDVQTALRDPLQDLAVNVTGTVNLLEACRKHGVERVIYASSAAVYGAPAALPLAEEAPCRPLSPY